MIVIQEDSNKSYPLMVAHHQTILDYSVNNQQIIHPFEIDTLIFEFTEVITFIEVVDIRK